MEVDKNLNKSSELKKLIVEYEKELYDLTGFMSKHPGGVNILQYKNNKNIENSFKTVEHSTAAKYLLKEYKVKSEALYTEQLEHLVDWNKPMVPQISKLGENYSEWINLPVDRPLRLFENYFLELLTKTPWYLPLFFWIPVIFYCVSFEASSFATTLEMYSMVFIHLFFGVCTWTLFEYCMHRFVFHIDVRKYPSLKTLHFMFHGNHHKVPFDEYRLVFPPIPAAVLVAIGYQLIRFLNYCYLIHYPKLFLAGILLGFLSYDMTHYFIHFASPTNNYFYNLKRYHYKHHFVDHEKGFGVSNTFWDGVFSTKIYLNKLKYMLKWKINK